MRLAASCALIAPVSLAGATCGGAASGEGAGGRSDAVGSSTIVWAEPPAGDGAGAGEAGAGSTEGGARSLWVVSPDDGALARIDASTLTELERFEVGDGPAGVARAGGAVVVTRGLAGRLYVLLDDRRSLGIDLPCAGSGAVVAGPPALGALAFVACPDDARVVAVDPAAGAVRALLEAPGRPTALAADEDGLLVTGSRTATLRRWTLDALRSALAAGPSAPASASGPGVTATALAPRAERTATQLDALAVSGDGASTFGALQLVDNDGDRDRAPERGGYGSAFDGDPRIEPWLVGPAACAGRYARYDAGARVASGPSALAWSARSRLLWVAHRFTGNVLVFACDAASTRGALAGVEPTGAAPRVAPAPLVAAFRVGVGAAGLALAPDGLTAYVDAAFDRAVVRLTVSAAAAGAGLDARADLAATTAEPAASGRRPDGPLRLSPAAEQGRRLFHDATNGHLTPSGIVTCATCHPAGGEDGLSWFLHTAGVPRKLRRTPPAWAARPAAAPFHWDGEFTDVAALTLGTVRELMGGDALVIDGGAVAAYLEGLPVPGPAVAMGSADDALRERGRALFESAAVGCAGCHAGPLHTDAVLHDALSPSVDPDARVERVGTPPLNGVRARAPYFHDGRAATLEDALFGGASDERHGRVTALSADDRAALLRYVEGL